jgi:hypothetical protein
MVCSLAGVALIEVSTMSKQEVLENGAFHLIKLSKLILPAKL